mmetsp:Transcript_39887/g.89594  ORF Transcript_39887/g.89594 Transcript_39887/m.89594 type:complete len:277 (+) Transcript_39887:48-878(+)
MSLMVGFHRGKANSPSRRPDHTEEPSEERAPAPLLYKSQQDSAHLACGKPHPHGVDIRAFDTHGSIEKGVQEPRVRCHCDSRLRPILKPLGEAPSASGQLRQGLPLPVRPKWVLLGLDGGIVYRRECRRQGGFAQALVASVPTGSLMAKLVGQDSKTPGSTANVLLKSKETRLRGTAHRRDDEEPQWRGGLHHVRCAWAQRHSLLDARGCELRIQIAVGCRVIVDGVRLRLAVPIGTPAPLALGDVVVALTVPDEVDDLCGDACGRFLRQTSVVGN